MPSPIWSLILYTHAGIISTLITSFFNGLFLCAYINTILAEFLRISSYSIYLSKINVKITGNPGVLTNYAYSRYIAFYLIKDKLSKKQIEDKILSTDAIYVGGGNTLKMMAIWKKLGVDKILKKAYRKGIVLSGRSAGSICWFKYGNSDSRKFTSGSNRLIKVTGLGLINALHCPHYDVEIYRQKDLKRMMKITSKVVAIAIESCCAIEVIDDKFRILKSKPDAKAYKIYWKQGKYFKEEIPNKKEFENLNDLLKK